MSKPQILQDIDTINNNLAGRAKQSDLNTLQNQVNGISASPKNVFATLSLLQADATANTTDGKKYIYVVTADGKWYYWNGSAWTAGAIYQSTGISDGSVLAQSLNFSNKILSANLNDETYEIGWLAIADGTKVTSATDMRCVNYMPVISGVGIKWTVTASSTIPSIRLIEYDVNKAFIKGTSTFYSVNSGNSVTTLTLDANTKFIKFAIYGYIDYANLKISIFYTSHVENNYIPYSVNYYIPTSTIAQDGTPIADVISKVRATRDVIYPLSSYSVTNGTASIDNYKKKNNNSSVKITATVGNIFNVAFSSLSIPIKPTDKVGIWIYVNKSSIETIDGNNIQLYTKLNGTISDNKYMTYYLHNGWNYYDISSLATQLTTITKIEFYTIPAVYDVTVWIDSVELNYRHKPCVMLGFDNCKDDNLYGKIYPLLKSKGFKGTFAWQTGAVPASTSGGELTKSHYDEMLKNGWDYAVYNGYGTVPTDKFTNNDANLQTWIAYLQSYLDLLETYGIFNPICYFSPTNASSQVLINAEKAVGLQMNRMQALSTYSVIEHFDKDSFETTCCGIGATTVVSDITARIDEAILKGTYLTIFTHAVEDSTTTNYNCLTSIYSGVLDYLKQKVDNGEIEVITYREFFQRWCPIQYSELMNIRQVKQTQYLLSKINS